MKNNLTSSLQIEQLIDQHFVEIIVVGICTALTIVILGLSIATYENSKELISEIGVTCNV